ncbi:MAG TPA: MAPEG family protein [Magnetospirillaceae bacterium]|jgi:uncharacterized MAPEG superfamily protein
MTINGDMLVLTLALLLLIQLVQGMHTSKLHGLPYSFSPRDKSVDVGLYGGRLQRAKINLIENLALFAPLSVLGEVLQNVDKGIIATGAIVFFVARVVHVICYVAGINGVRTLAWLACVVGSVMVALGVLGWA